MGHFKVSFPNDLIVIIMDLTNSHPTKNNLCTLNVYIYIITTLQRMIQASMSRTNHPHPISF